DGEWMRSWQERVKAAGANLLGDEGYIVNEAPSDDDIAKLKALGKELVGA
ncbi:MAG TPA: flavodoxin, partial [Ruminococcus sp.]|nr:flavodoxin [Ruminococcus sp.]